MGLRFKTGKLYHLHNLETRTDEFWQVVLQDEDMCKFIVYTELSYPIAVRMEIKQVFTDDTGLNEFVLLSTDLSQRLWAIPVLIDLLKLGEEEKRNAV